MGRLLEMLFGTGGGASYIDNGQRFEVADPMQLPTVVAARQLLADTVAQFPLYMVDDRTGKRTDEIPPILRRPDPTEPRADTVEKIVNALTGWGGAWLLSTSTGTRGNVISIEAVSPTRVQYVLDATNTRFLAVEIDGRRVDMRTVQYVPFILDANSPKIGTSPLILVYNELEKLAQALRFSADYYGNGAVPPYALTTPTRLADGKAKELLDAWTSARVENRPAVISGQVDLKTFTPVSARDALVIDAIGMLDATIARVMQCPPSLLNTPSQSSLTYSTVRDEYRKFLAGIRASYLIRLEDAFSRYLPRGYSAEFDTSAITQLDTSEQMDFDIRGIDAGIFTVDEIRARRGLEQIGNANERIVTP